jgi:hypothetical protein
MNGILANSLLEAPDSLTMCAAILRSLGVRRAYFALFEPVRRSRLLFL